MANNIHKTAIIDPTVTLGDNITIDAYSVIDAGVTIGDGTYVGKHVVITGKNTTIGKNNKFYNFCSIGEIPQDKKYNNEETYLLIGDNNVFREYCSVNTGTAVDTGGEGYTKIGDNNWILAYGHIAHDCLIGNNVTLSNNAALAGHVIIGDFVVFGGYVKVHQFVTIGSYAMVAADTMITQNVLPCCMVSDNLVVGPRGINKEGLIRANFTPDMIKKMRFAYDAVYRSEMSYSEAQNFIIGLAKDQDEYKIFIEFFELTSKEKRGRGIVR